MFIQSTRLAFLHFIHYGKNAAMGPRLMHRHGRVREGVTDGSEIQKIDVRSNQYSSAPDGIGNRNTERPREIHALGPYGSETFREPKSSSVRRAVGTRP